jgi:hypothetical protein
MMMRSRSSMWDLLSHTGCSSAPNRVRMNTHVFRLPAALTDVPPSQPDQPAQDENRCEQGQERER